MTNYLLPRRGMKTVNVEITTKTPTVISSGDTVYNFQYWISDDNYLYIPSIDGLLELIARKYKKTVYVDLSDEIIEFMNNIADRQTNKNKDLIGILGTGFIKRNLSGIASRKIKILEDIGGNRLNIGAIQVRDGFDKVYIPGSSIKGEFENIIIGKEIKNDESLKEKLVEYVKEALVHESRGIKKELIEIDRLEKELRTHADREVRKRLTRNYYRLSVKVDRIINQAYRNWLKEIFNEYLLRKLKLSNKGLNFGQLISVSDAYPSNEAETGIYMVQRMYKKSPKSGVKQFIEAIKPGTKFGFTLSYLDNLGLENYIKKGEELRIGWGKGFENTALDLLLKTDLKERREVQITLSPRTRNFNPEGFPKTEWVISGTGEKLGKVEIRW